MDAIIKVKQVADTYAISTGLSKYNRSRMPNCGDNYQVALGVDSRYLTGIDEKAIEIHLIKDEKIKAEKQEELKSLRENLERLTGDRLDALSPYWETFIMQIDTNHDLILDMSNPRHVIIHRALIANGLAAPNFESTGEPKYRNAKYYCFTEERFEKDKVTTQKLRDEARGKLLEISNDDDYMVVLGQYLEGFRYKKGLKPDTLYSMLSDFIERDKDSLDSFLKATKTPVEELQYKITVDKAIKAKKIKYKDGQYYRGGVNLGKGLKEVLSTLKSPEYANEFISIQDEVS